MAEISRGSRPKDLSRLKVSRQEIPASTRIRALELSTIAQFPRLPLASIETQTPMSLEHTFNYCESGSNFSVKRYFRAKSPGAGSSVIRVTLKTSIGRARGESLLALMPKQFVHSQSQHCTTVSAGESGYKAEPRGPYLSMVGSLAKRNVGDQP